MRCPHCDTFVASDATTCWLCHRELAATPDASPTAAPPAWGSDMFPAAPAPRRRSRRGLIAVAAVLVVALVGGLVWFVRRDSSPHWDARVLPIVRFVEAERGLEFQETVPIAFVPDQDFRKLVSGDAAKLTKKDKLQIETATSTLRGLGLVTGELDLFAAVSKLQGEALLAFYDPDEKEVKVRGTQLTARTSATLAHELTHALQDQYFDLGDRHRYDNTDRSSVYLALIEGDASRVGDAYEEAHPAKLASAGQSIDDVPEILQVILQSPYALGPSLVNVLLHRGGRAALDTAFRDPPHGDLVELNPITASTGTPPAHVDEPTLQAGETKLRGYKGTDFGSLILFAMLAAHLDPRTALAAADGWGGDAYVAFKRDDTVCVRVNMRGSSPPATQRIADAIEQLATIMPAGAVTVARDADVITFTSCDPGSATPPLNSMIDAFSLPVARAELLDSFLDSGAELAGAACAAQRVVDGIDLEVLSADSLSKEETTELQQQVASYIQECRGATN